jgi:hypothetical protein
MTEPQTNTKRFEKTGDVKPTIVYQTTDKVSSLTYTALIEPKVASTTPLVYTIVMSADGKEIQKVDKTISGKETIIITYPVVGM